MKKSLILGMILSMVFMFAVLAGSASALIYVNNCQTLNVPGETYMLENDILAAGTCLKITANNIVLDGNGFTVTGPGSGMNYAVQATGVTGVTVKNLDVTKFSTGIFFDYSDSNTLTNIRSYGNTIGIYLRGSSFNTITGIEVTSNTAHGLYIISNSDNNNIYGNTATGNGQHGVHFHTCDGNIVSENVASSNSFTGFKCFRCNNHEITGNTANSNAYNGIEFVESNNNIVTGNTANSNTESGIHFQSSNDNTATENTASLNGIGMNFHYACGNNNAYGNNIGQNNENGIRIYNSDNNDINHNNVDSNDIGIKLDRSDYNTITGNTVEYNNIKGIDSIYSNGNTIYNNYFKNPVNAGVSGGTGNMWNIVLTLGTNIVGGPYLGGNFWTNLAGTGPSDTCIDADSNGICDLPYTISPGNIDYLPLGGVSADTDGDGVIDADDACPTVYGYADRQGCPYGDLNIVELHIIDQAKIGDCGNAGSCKLPLANVIVKVFDRNDAAFQNLWTKNPDGMVYADVFDADVGRIATCTTDIDGKCTAGEESPGDYLVIVQWLDTATGKTVYTGKPKSGSDFVNGLATKEFQILKVNKKNGEVQFSGGSKTNIRGSFLSIVYSDTAVWETTNFVYPFIFTSDSDWSVDLCAKVPSGYKITGVYDEFGNLVSASDCMQTFVTGQTKVVAFDVLETGSPEPTLTARLKLTHNGKTTPLTLNTKGIRIARQKADKAKGLPFTGGATAPTSAMSNIFVALIVLAGAIAIIMLLLYRRK